MDFGILLEDVFNENNNSIDKSLFSGGKVLYFGSFLDFYFIKDFTDIKDFLIIDNRKSYSVENNFYNNIINSFKNNGFELLYSEKIKNRSKFKKICSSICGYSYIDQILYIFMNFKTSQQIRYYLSTNLNNLNNMIKMEISSSDIILLHNEIPDVKLFELFTTPKVFIGYPYNPFRLKDNKQNIYNFLLNNNNNNKIIGKYISEFYLYNPVINNIIKCNSFKDFLYSFSLKKN
jgi:hypothetical protein